MIQNEIRETLKQVGAVLNRHHVDCMLIGGAAVGFYGHQRISGISLLQPEMKSDLDFWYNPTNENFLAIVRSLNELGVETSELENIIFDPQKTFLKIPFEKFHLDFLPHLSGLESYSVCKKRTRNEIIDDNKIAIIGLSDLIANKIAVNREIDRKDIDQLRKQ